MLSDLQFISKLSNYKLICLLWALAELAKSHLKDGYLLLFLDWMSNQSPPFWHPYFML